MCRTCDVKSDKCGWLPFGDIDLYPWQASQVIEFKRFFNRPHGLIIRWCPVRLRGGLPRYVVSNEGGMVFHHPIFIFRARVSAMLPF